MFGRFIAFSVMREIFQWAFYPERSFLLGTTRYFAIDSELPAMCVDLLAKCLALDPELNLPSHSTNAFENNLEYHQCSFQSFCQHVCPNSQLLIPRIAMTEVLRSSPCLHWTILTISRPHERLGLSEVLQQSYGAWSPQHCLHPNLVFRP